MSKRVWIVLLGIICVAGGASALALRTGMDRQGPVIGVPTDPVTYHEGEDTSVLLEGVSAKDDTDGDVTASVIVEAVYPSTDDRKAKVVYAAVDESNNVTKVSRMVDYVPAEGRFMETETERETDSEAAAAMTAGVQREPGMTEAEVKEAYIAVVNGTDMAGVAADWKAYLEGKGFTHVYTGSTAGGNTATVIYAEDTALSEALLEYFPEARTQAGMPSEGIDISLEGTDACIVVGSDHMEAE